MAEILAIDIGTSRIKCAFFREDGTMIGLVDRRLDRAANPDTQDAEVWVTSVAELLKHALPGHHPDAVSLTGNMHALLGIDKTGRPAAPAILWSDNSATEESDFLNREYGKKLLAEYGNVSIPVFTLPKLLKEKEIRKRSVVFLQSKDYIGYRLTGKFATDPTDASGVLGMRLADNRWDEAFLQELRLPLSLFPEILPSASCRGKVTQQAAALTGLQEGTPVITGCGDLSSAALGSGAGRRTLSLTLGTAGQLLAAGTPGTGRKFQGKLFVFAHADPSMELYLGSVPAGGFSLEWLSKQHNLSMPEFFRLAETLPLSRDLPVFLPYLLGRGAPYMDYTPCGGWSGLSANDTLARLCRGAVTGTLCPLRQCADLFEQFAGKMENIVLQALACREKAVRETAAALFPQKQKLLPLQSEASLLGAAAVGMTGLGVYPDAACACKAMVQSRPAESVSDALREEAEAYYRKFLVHAGKI